MTRLTKAGLPDQRVFNGGGRPETKVDLEWIKAQLAAGVPQLQVAAEAGVSWPTILRQLKNDPSWTQGVHSGAMTAEEFMSIRRRLKLSSAKISIILNVDESTVRRWTMRAKGKSRIPHPTALALRFLIKYPQEIAGILHQNKDRNVPVPPTTKRYSR